MNSIFLKLPRPRKLYFESMRGAIAIISLWSLIIKILSFLPSPKCFHQHESHSQVENISWFLDLLSMLFHSSCKSSNWVQSSSSSNFKIFFLPLLSPLGEAHFCILVIFNVKCSIRIEPTLKVNLLVEDD